MKVLHENMSYFIQHFEDPGFKPKWFLYHFTSAPKRKVAQLFLILLALANNG